MWDANDFTSNVMIGESNISLISLLHNIGQEQQLPFVELFPSRKKGKRSMVNSGYVRLTGTLMQPTRLCVDVPDDGITKNDDLIRLPLQTSTTNKDDSAHFNHNSNPIPDPSYDTNYGTRSPSNACRRQEQQVRLCISPLSAFIRYLKAQSFRIN